MRRFCGLMSKLLPCFCLVVLFAFAQEVILVITGYLSIATAARIIMAAIIIERLFSFEGDCL